MLLYQNQLNISSIIINIIDKKVDLFYFMYYNTFWLVISAGKEV